MKFILEIECNTPAFGDDAYQRSDEVSNILRTVEQEVFDGAVYGIVRDTNSNFVGTYKFTEA